MLNQNENPNSAAVKLEVSVVVPIYNEEGSVEELVCKIIQALQSETSSYEIILVDDGSNDATPEKLYALQRKHKKVKNVVLAKNYGQSTAMQAGFDHSVGEFVAVLDGDLQNDPNDIVKLLRVMRETGVDLVSGWRKSRKDDFLRVTFSKFANAIISKITGIKLHDYGCSLKVYRRSLLEKIRIYGELHRFLPAIISEVGARIVEVEVTHSARKHGVSKYKLDRTFRVILDLILIFFFKRYIHRPLHFFGGLGFVSLLLGMGVSGYLTFIKLFLHQSIGGRPLLVLAEILIICSVILIGQGIIGELLIRVLYEPKGRKQYQLAVQNLSEHYDALKE